MVFFAETGPTTQRSCDVILSALVKTGMWVTAGSSSRLGRVYRKDTEPLYHSFMYSHLSITRNAFIACYIICDGIFNRHLPELSGLHAQTVEGEGGGSVLTNGGEHLQYTKTNHMYTTPVLFI